MLRHPTRNRLACVDFGRILESLAERRFPNRLRARGWLGGHLATVEHGKPVWKPALRRSTKDSRMRPRIDESPWDGSRSVNAGPPHFLGPVSGCVLVPVAHAGMLAPTCGKGVTLCPHRSL